MLHNHSSEIKRRIRLHALYSKESELPDASRLAYLGGPLVRWTEKNIAALWSKAPLKTIIGGPVESHLYVHVPFCKSICQFCNYERLRPSNSKELEKSRTDDLLPSVAAITEDEEEENSDDSSNDSGQMKLF